MRGAVPPFSQYVFMTWCSVKHRDNFTFTFLPFEKTSVQKQNTFQPISVICLYFNLTFLCLAFDNISYEMRNRKLLRCSCLYCEDRKINRITDTHLVIHFCVSVWTSLQRNLPAHLKQWNDFVRILVNMRQNAMRSFIVEYDIYLPYFCDFLQYSVHSYRCVNQRHIKKVRNDKVI